MEFTLFVLFFYHNKQLNVYLLPSMKKAITVILWLIHHRYDSHRWLNLYVLMLMVGTKIVVHCHFIAKTLIV